MFEKYHAVYNSLTRYSTDTWIWKRDIILTAERHTKENETLTKFKRITCIDINMKTLLECNF